MRRRKKLTFFLILLPISLLLLISGYAMLKMPLKIIDLQAFHTDKSNGRIVFCIDCINTSHKKTIDSFVLSVICNSDEQTAFKCRVLEPEGILPKKNRVFLVDFYEYQLPAKDFDTIEVTVSQIGFNDGSIAENFKMQKSITANVDGNIGTGAFPIKINEVCVYEKSATPYAIDPIPFQVDWSNLSEESIIGVTYKVKAKTADGEIVLFENGDDCVYVSEFYEKPNEWIQPLSDNKVVDHRMFGSNFRRKGAVFYEVSVCRAITSKGVIWENSNENDKIEAIMRGKKGYGFSEFSDNPSIQGLVERIDKEFQKYKINLGTPKFFIKSQHYCILRYLNLDVRVELSEENEVCSDKVGFAYYSKIQYDNPEKYVQSIKDELKILRLCIGASVLTDISYTEVVQKISEYNNNDKAYIDFDDLSYDTFENVYNFVDENNNRTNCCIFACGRDLYYPPNKLFWVRESPYESQRNLEVQHRQ